MRVVCLFVNVCPTSRRSKVCGGRMSKESLLLLHDAEKKLRVMPSVSASLCVLGQDEQERQADRGPGQRTKRSCVCAWTVSCAATNEAWSALACACVYADVCTWSAWSG